MIDDIIKGAVEALFVCLVTGLVIAGIAQGVDKLAEDRREAMKRPLKVIEVVCVNKVCTYEQCHGSMEEVYECLDSLTE